MIVAMDIGMSFTYSRYLFIHRQQIHNESIDEYPLVNIVSYNSKRLFENIDILHQHDKHNDSFSVPVGELSICL